MRLFEDESLDELYEDLEPDPVSESQARASLHGREFDDEALAFVASMGARVVDRDLGVHGYHLDALVEGTNGERFYVDGHGTPDRTDRPQAGMRRTDTLLKFGFKAWRLHEHGAPHRLILVTSHLPRAGSGAAFLLGELTDVLLDAVATVGDLAGQQRLRHYFTAAEPLAAPPPAPWRRTDQLSLLEDGSRA